MKPFLYNIAEVFYNTFGNQVTDFAFIFPNRRSGIFFQKYLAFVVGKPIFSPKILTINDLFVSLTNLMPADKTGMLFWLYEQYQEITQSKETFDEFVYWGEMLLNDFDDIDKYVVNAHQLFTNIQDLKQIDAQFDYLNDEQVESIRRFWEHFIPSFESHKKQDFAATWEILYELYDRFREMLQEKGLAYEGMIFRQVAEQAIDKIPFDLPYKQIVFVGLNALTHSERILMNYLNDNGVADFYWDYDSPHVSDRNNRASFFMFENLRMFPSKLEVPKFKREDQPSIELIGIPSAVGQSKQVYKILEELITSKNIDNPGKAINTAIVLPDETLLLPTLYSIPEVIDPINVTMGYVLSNTPIAGLMEHIYELQRNIRFREGKPVFYHRMVLPILNHHYIVSFDPVGVKSLNKIIVSQNKIFLSAQELAINPLLALLFTPVTNAMQASDYLIKILEYLQKSVNMPESDPDQDANQEPRVNLTALELEFIYHYYITVNRLREVINENPVQMNITTYLRLLKKMAAMISIPFRGEPLSGIQIMGVLETRALDFDNLIILSMNEGVFPLRKAANSFIPHNLRKGFGLSTTEHQDSIFAYHFYRMIGRAKNVYLIYDTRSDGLQTGEVSRFVYQLQYHYRMPIVEKVVTYNINIDQPQAIVMQKNDAVLKRLDQYLENGKRALSASAINTYINCPLQFYLQYVEQLSEEDQISETIEADTFGSIFHRVMELVYERAQGQLVTADYLQAVVKEPRTLTKMIREAFAEIYFKSEKAVELTGQNFLIGEIIRKYVKKVLDYDRKLTPLLYIQSEMLLNLDFLIAASRKVRLKAFIDRIDEFNGVVRIIDYKTGQGDLTFKSMEDLFDKTNKQRPKAVMQVFMYSMMYNSVHHPKAIQPAIYYLRNFFGKSFDPAVNYKSDQGSERVNDYLNFDNDFKAAFTDCLNEIFNPEVPFTQTENIKNCEYCSFSAICKR